MSTKVFSLFANCIPVKGAKQSIICDVYRRRYHAIPNALYYILKTYKHHTVQEVKTALGASAERYIDEYFDFLKEQEYIFFLEKEERKLFPALDMTFDYPAIISNCIIDINRQSKHDYKKINTELKQLLNEQVELRFFSEITTKEITRIISHFDMEFNLQLLIPYHPEFTIKDIEQLSANPVVSALYLYSVPEARMREFKILEPYNVRCFENSHLNEKCCGSVSPSYFTVNRQMFTESQKYNSCLNKKISVDVSGNIKNCPSMKKNYGNIHENSLKDAAENTDFKMLWNIPKSKISVCRDCEFRYICTDCRAYTENPDDLYSKPLKCGYDPYTTKWSEWSTNSLKKKAIEYYEITI